MSDLSGGYFQCTKSSLTDIPHVTRRTSLSRSKLSTCFAADYSTVTDFAKLRGWSTSVPFAQAT